ncbi:type II toxin-antitoxin system VapB family antitoxin [Bosea sp. LjRoot237]|uniref:type II toxin-antitoxin system VapB family antitoxin n=1 Tax=Bosea sp. LjRoot237 TaxID=3342292 RepID=UPI003ECC6440
MGILVRDEKIDRQVRELAVRCGETLQGAIGLAVENELKRLDERKERIERAFREARERLAAFPIVDDGMTHKEFFDREYGDA